jgi:hypothetical protein
VVKVRQSRLLELRQVEAGLWDLRMRKNEAVRRVVDGGVGFGKE